MRSWVCFGLSVVKIEGGRFGSSLVHLTDV
jgi:hypothetical protein